jgi:hypothetical protein
VITGHQVATGREKMTGPLIIHQKLPHTLRLAPGRQVDLNNGRTNLMDVPQPLVKLSSFSILENTSTLSANYCLKHHFNLMFFYTNR